MKIPGSAAGILRNVTRSVLLLLAALLMTTCRAGTLNVNPDAPAAPTRLRAILTVPAGMIGGQFATWVIDWSGDPGPVTAELDLGLGASPRHHGPLLLESHGHAITVCIHNPTLIDDATYEAVLTVTNSAGSTVRTDERYVAGPGGNQQPDITAYTYDPDQRLLEIVAEDYEGDEVFVAASAGKDTHLLLELVSFVNETPQDPEPSPCRHVSRWRTTYSVSTDHIFEGASGSVHLIADDGSGGTSHTEEIEVSIPPIQLLPDTLIAVPLKSEVASSDGNRNTADGGVTVVVATGVPANPLGFMNGVGVTVESAATFRSNSFNAGEPGGGNGDIDGYWTAMNPGGGFLLPPDSFIQATDIGGGMERWDFNLTPIGGSDQTEASGQLFNFVLEFAEPGIYHIGLQEFETINRTFYQDSQNNFHFWSDISNAGVPKTVNVRAEDQVLPRRR